MLRGVEGPLKLHLIETPDSGLGGVFNQRLNATNPSEIRRGNLHLIEAAQHFVAKVDVGRRHLIFPRKKG